MDFYFGLGQLIGVHTLLGLSAYIVLLTGQVSLAQAAFFAVGACAAAMFTVLAGWHIVPALGVGSFLGAVTACAVPDGADTELAVDVVASIPAIAGLALGARFGSPSLVS